MDKTGLNTQKMIYHPSFGGQPKTAPIKNNGKIEKDYGINWDKMQKVIDDLHKKPSVIPIPEYLRQNPIIGPGRGNDLPYGRRAWPGDPTMKPMHGYDAPFGRGPKPRDPIMDPVVDRDPRKQPVLQNPLEGFWGKPVTTNPTPTENPRLDQRIKDEIVKLKSGKAKPSNSESKVDKGLKSQIEFNSKEISNSEKAKPSNSESKVHKGLKSQTEVNLKEMKSKRNYKL